MEQSILFGPGDRPRHQHKVNLFTDPEWKLDSGPEWKLDGGPGYDDDSRAHFGPFDPPSPLRYGPPDGWGKVLH